MRQDSDLEYDTSMRAGEFTAGEWVERLARGLAVLARAQGHYLAGYKELAPHLQAAFGALDGIPPAFSPGRSA